MLTFDDQGCLDPSAFGRHRLARAELALAPSIAHADWRATLVDAASRFVAQGGRWAPSRTLARVLEDAALGRLKCPRMLVRRYPSRGPRKFRDTVDRVLVPRWSPSAVGFRWRRTSADGQEGTMVRRDKRTDDRPVFVTEETFDTVGPRTATRPYRPLADCRWRNPGGDFQ